MMTRSSLFKQLAMERPCDHILGNQILRRTSTGLGSTTCSFFYKEPDNDHRLYAGNFWAVNVTNFDSITNTCPPKKCANPETITDPVLKQLCNTSYTWD
ncbi:hypothetical protein COOONC_11490, partial [Cooperia oncophora]